MIAAIALQIAPLKLKKLFVLHYKIATEQAKKMFQLNNTPCTVTIENFMGKIPV